MFCYMVDYNAVHLVERSGMFHLSILAADMNFDADNRIRMDFWCGLGKVILILV